MVCCAVNTYSFPRRVLGVTWSDIIVPGNNHLEMTAVKAIIRKGFGVTAAVLALSMFGFAAEAQQKAPDPAAPAAKAPATKAPATKAPATKPAAKPKSACNAIKEEAGCKADAKCQWIGETTTKAGQKRKAYCKVKSTPPAPKKKAAPAAAPKATTPPPAPKATTPPPAPKKTQ